MATFIPADDLQILESPVEVLSTLTLDGKRRWLYPVESPGRYLQRRRAVGWGLIALFVALPLVRIKGRPAVLLDLATREFTLFGTVFTPTDTFLLLLLGVIALVSIILVTALWGRVWCGWGCPQTVYLEFVFRPIERMIEGPEHIRKRRDEGPMTTEKAVRKGAKWAVFLLLAVALAHVFVSYFAGWDRLVRWMSGDPRDHWGYFLLMGGTAGLVAFDFGVFREQMCTIACPYARMQSVITDADSDIVAYDPSRGEPRGRGKNRSGLGDCVDCLACVRTCPTGIDIRDGLQMECVACTQCIDACDAIMDRTGQPRGLIRYASEREIESATLLADEIRDAAAAAGNPITGPVRVAGQTARRWRPRTVLYALLLVVLCSAFAWQLATREAVKVTVGRSVGAPFVEMPDGRIANRLVFRLQNQRPEATTVTITGAAPEGVEVRIIGRTPVTIPPTDHVRVETFVLVPRERLASGETTGRFVLTFPDGSTREETFALLGPTM